MSKLYFTHKMRNVRKNVKITKNLNKTILPQAAKIINRTINLKSFLVVQNFKIDSNIGITFTIKIVLLQNSFCYKIGFTTE